MIALIALAVTAVIFLAGGLYLSIAGVEEASAAIADASQDVGPSLSSTQAAG